MHRSSITAAMVIVLLSGCSQYRDPKINVLGGRLGESGADASQILLELNLENPNAESLRLLDVEYQVRMSGSRTYHGTRAVQRTLPPRSSQTIVIPAVIRDSSGSSLAESQATFSIEGELRYITPGAFAETLFDIGVRKPRAGFHGAGRIEGPDSPD